jgi:purine nucleosidase
MKRIIIDTDIGTDVDDALALAYLYANQNEIDVVGITTVGGDTELRKNIAYTFLDSITKAQSQKKDTNWRKVPIQTPLKNGHGVSMDGRNGFMSGVEATNYQLQLSPQVDSEKLTPNTLLGGVDELAIEDWYLQKLDAPTTLLAIGALTNIAKTIEKHPHVKKSIERIYFMGGVREESGLYVPNEESHNVKEDTLAAKIVFESKIPLTILTKEIPLRFPYTLAEFEARFLGKSQLHTLLYNHAQEMIQKSKRDCVYLYDPILAMLAHDESLASYSAKGHIKKVKEIHFHPKQTLEAHLQKYVP